MIYQTTTVAPTRVYFAVVETTDADGNSEYHYSRPYTRLKTARMRLTTISRDNTEVVTNAWVMVSHLRPSSVAVEESESPRRRLRCRECKKTSASVRDRTLTGDGGMIRRCDDCFDRLMELIEESESGTP